MFTFRGMQQEIRFRARYMPTMLKYSFDDEFGFLIFLELPHMRVMSVLSSVQKRNCDFLIEKLDQWTHEESGDDRADADSTQNAHVSCPAQQRAA